MSSACRTVLHSGSLPSCGGGDRLQSGHEIRVPADTAAGVVTIGQFVALASREERVVVKPAYVDAGRVQKRPEESLTRLGLCRLVEIVRGVIARIASEVIEHVRERPVPFVAQILLEATQLVQAEQVVIQPLG